MPNTFVSHVVNRLIFPNGLRGYQPSARAGELSQPVVASAGPRSSITHALDRFNPVTPVLQRVLPTDFEMSLPVAPSRLGLLKRILPSKPPQGAVTSETVSQAAERVANASNSSAFKVSRTRPVDDGFEVTGYPRWKGITLPLRIGVQMGLGSTSDGSWALSPNKVSVWGVSSAKLLNTVNQALRSLSSLQHDEKTGRFRIVIS